MSKKVLFCATVRSHIGQFHIPYLKFFREQGYEVHVAARDNSLEKNIEIQEIDHFYDVPFERSPFKFQNLLAYKEFKKILISNDYSIIHCNTPMGGVIARIAAKNNPDNKARLIYTAHGFHFFKGAPKLNWMLYLPIEKWLSKYTNCLITINEEDYQTAKSYKFKADSIRLVDGVGVDFKKFTPQTTKDKIILREEYSFNKDSFILLYAAELTYRKHQDLVIDSVSLLKEKIPNIKLLIAGVGNREEQYKEQVRRLCLDNYVQFLGYRRDIPNLMKLADVAVSSSRQEGLPINIIEAMATGLPLVVTDCRGNRDLVSNGKNGYVVGIDDVNGFANSIEKLARSESTRKQFSENSQEIVKKYSVESVIKQMISIYSII